MDKEVIISLIWFSFFIILIIKKLKEQLPKVWSKPYRAVVIIEDLELQCTHCKHNLFIKREGLLTTTWVTFFHLQFLNQSGSCYVCEKCSCVHWFIVPKEKAYIEHEDWNITDKDKTPSELPPH